MNLHEFIEQRTHCPFCGNELFLNYHCARRQTLRFEDGKAIYISRLDDYPYRVSGTKYKIGHSFDTKGDGWCAEFYDAENIRLREVPLRLIKKFVEKVDKVNSRHPSCFIKQCSNSGCGMYAGSTTDFRLNFNNPIVDFEMKEEVFTFGQQVDAGLKIFVLRNLPMENTSHLTCSIDPSTTTKNFPGNTSIINLPLVPFVSKEETLARLNKLMVFS